MMVPCAGFREISDCGQGELAEYAGRGNASHFDFINIIGSSIALAAPDDADDAWVASIAAANSALLYMMEDVVPEQIDSSRRLNPGNQNATLARYTFDFLPDDPFTNAPAVATFPGSRLLAAGCPVTAEYILVRGAIDISLIIERENPHDGMMPPPAPDAIVRPLFRVEVRATMGLRVRLNDVCTFTRTWLDPVEEVVVTLVDNFSRRGPIVLSNGVSDLDSILYVDSEGRRFDPLMRVRWVGQLGYLTNPVAPDLVEAAGGGGLNCQGIINRMSGISIPAVSSHLGVPDGGAGAPDPGGRGIIHTGTLRLGFPEWE